MSCCTAIVILRARLWRYGLIINDLAVEDVLFGIAFYMFRGAYVLVGTCDEFGYYAVVEAWRSPSCLIRSTEHRVNEHVVQHRRLAS